jgi:hypothetical protein
LFYLTDHYPILPQTDEVHDRKLRIPDSRLDRAVPEVVLNGAGVASIIGELAAARVAQHVGVNLPTKPSFDTDPPKHAGKPGGHHR